MRLGLVLFASAFAATAALAQQIEDQKLTPADGESDDWFGFAAAVDGDRLLIGAPNHDLGATVDAGAAYPFAWNAVTSLWEPRGKLTASDAAESNFFGHSISIDGDFAVIGAFGRESGGVSRSGAAYVFRWNAAQQSWQEEQTLMASEPGLGANLGVSLAISADLVIVGASSHRNDANESVGAAHLFRRNVSTGVWEEEERLLGKSLLSSFGASVGISGEEAVVGVPQDSEKGFRAGAAYTYAHAGAGAWIEGSKLTAWDRSGSDGRLDHFGQSVSMSGDSILIGAPASGDVADRDGAAYVFRRISGGTWRPEQQILVPTVPPENWLGWSVSIRDDRLVAGARETHAAFVCDWDGAHWRLAGELASSENDPEDQFGSAVSLDDTTVLVGAPGNNASPARGGEAYSFAPLPALPSAISCPEPLSSSLGIASLISLAGVTGFRRRASLKRRRTPFDDGRAWCLGLCTPQRRISHPRHQH